MSDFRDVEEIRDEGNVVLAIITAKKRQNGTNLYSFMFMREFENAGRIQRTNWMNERHGEAVARLIPRVTARIRQLASFDTMPEAEQ